MPGPFELFGGILLATFKITGLLFVSVIQAAWYLIFRKPDKVGDVFGYLGRGVVEAIADIFKSGSRR